eukprot:11531-Eustigmatos_ZCMA.PRE.1
MTIPDTQYTPSRVWEGGAPPNRARTCHTRYYDNQEDEDRALEYPRRRMKRFIGLYFKQVRVLVGWRSIVGQSAGKGRFSPKDRYLLLRTSRL